MQSCSPSILLFHCEKRNTPIQADSESHFAKWKKPSKPAVLISSPLRASRSSLVSVLELSALFRYGVRLDGFAAASVSSCSDVDSPASMCSHGYSPVWAHCSVLYLDDSSSLTRSSVLYSDGSYRSTRSRAYYRPNCRWSSRWVDDPFALPPPLLHSHSWPAGSCLHLPLPLKDVPLQLPGH
jgi:hypothetical protein